MGLDVVDEAVDSVVPDWAGALLMSCTQLAGNQPVCLPWPLMLTVPSHHSAPGDVSMYVTDTSAPFLSDSCVSSSAA